jgi:chemotaxis protein MotB
MADGAIAKVIAGMAVVGASATGAYAWDLRAKSHTATAQAEDEKTKSSELDGKLSLCNRTLDDEKGKREGTEKLAAEAAANLDASRAEIEGLREQRAEDDKRLAAFRAMSDKFRKMIDSGKLEVVIRHGRMVVKLPASVLFSSGSADLSKDGQSALTEVATILKQFPDRRFMVAGHTDNVPTLASSGFKDNWQLSTARAVTVTEQLVSAGMNPTHLSAAGYGEYEPVRDNGAEAGRQENRRIEIVLLPNLRELPPNPDGTKPAPSAAPKPSASSPDKAK